jgi:hypothetical protein
MRDGYSYPNLMTLNWRAIEPSGQCGRFWYFPRERAIAAVASVLVAQLFRLLEACCGALIGDLGDNAVMAGCDTHRFLAA